MIDILPVFIKYVVFHQVDLLCIIETKDEYKFSFEEHYIEWCIRGQIFNKKTCQNLYGPIF